MTITERPSSAAEGEDLPRRALEAVCARGPIGLAEEIGDATHLLVELLREPQNLFDPEEHGSHDYTQLLGRIHEAGSALGALQAHTVVSHAAATRREDRRAARDQAAHEADVIAPQARTDDRADQRSGKDLSLITRRSPSEASHALRASRRLVESMPNLLGALTDGKITADIAHKAASKAGSLEPEECRELDRLLGERLPDLDGAGTRRWGQEISAAIQGLDPDGAVGRHQRARRERCVTLRPGEHGMATLSARLPGIDAAQAHKRLSLEAERLRADGDRRGHQAIMADVLVDTILGRDDQMDPTTLDIGLIITDRALFSPDDGEIAQVEGYGAVPAEAVREQLRAALRDPKAPQEDRYGPDGPTVRAVLRRLYTHPTSGELVAVESKAKVFPSALARFLRWRDLSCRGPFCNAAIRQSDHIVPRSTGGPTSIDNGQGACAHDNGKEEHFRSVRRIPQPPGGGHRVEWTSPNGISRTTSPPPLTRPSRTPAAEPEASPPRAGPREDSPPDGGTLEGPPDGGTLKDGTASEAARPDAPPEATPPDFLPPDDAGPGAQPDGQPPEPDQRE
ncbi:MAG TPA: HNH endonuclease [Candidatus Brachybacterium merdavium]|uniref:HNH endonuclease n=1 Tax=Candidatus Brachybacterium merdavium TaxID=2838513 RepID=A0A9D2LE19_9MICO|nr:HNH endonuclease [Candidatus Brachybacterium merdavium]